MGIEIVPNIKLVDHTPTPESPHNHIHCDICESPKDKVVYLKEPPQYVSTNKGKNHKLVESKGFFLCKGCLTIALNVIDQEAT